MELLANAIRNNPNIQGLQISKRRPNAKKKINLFADDCVIFGYGKPDYDAIEVTMDLLALLHYLLRIQNSAYC